MNYFFNPFNVSEEDGPHGRRPPHHHGHPYGPEGFAGRRFGRHCPPSFGHEWRGPFEREGRQLPPWFFEAFGGRGGGFHRGGRGGGYGFHGHGHEGFGPRGFFGPRGWDFPPPREDDYSSNSNSEEEDNNKNPKMPEEIVLSDSSDSDVQYLGQEKGRCRGRRCGKNKIDGCRRRRFCGREKRQCRRNGFNGRQFGHFRGRCPWSQKADEVSAVIIPVEDVPDNDFQIIQDDVAAEIGNLNLQPDKTKTNKKCFKVALNVDGFKLKDIRIRRNSNILFIEGKQNAETQLGTFQRSFAYKIAIPDGIDPKKIKAKLDSDGILQIKGKKSHAANDAEKNEEEEEILLQE